MDQRTQGTGADGIPLAQFLAWSLNEDTQLPDLNFFVEAQTLGNGKEFTTPDPADQDLPDFPDLNFFVEAQTLGNGKEFTTPDPAGQELLDLNYFVEAQTLGNGKDFTTPDPADQAHQEDTRHVHAQMQLPMVKSVLKTGLNRDSVRNVIERRLRETGNTYPNAEALMNAVLNYERNRGELNASSPHHQGPPQIRQTDERRNGRRRSKTSSYQEETRQAHAYMQSPMVQSVLNTGVDRDRVRNVIERRLRDTGNTYSSAETLMNAVLNSEQNLEDLNASSPFHKGPPQICQTDKHCNARRRSRTSTSSHQEETRQVHAQMQSPMVQMILNTGVNRDRVRNAIEKRLRDTGNAFPSADALMNAVLNFGQNREVLNTQSSRDQDPPVIPKNAPQSHSTCTEVRGLSSQNPDLETENSMLRQKTQCKVCLNADARFHFRPCGHLCCCETCASRVTTCPVCRANIDEKLKIYFS